MAALSKKGLEKNINRPFLLFIRLSIQFPDKQRSDEGRSDKQRKTAILRLIIFGLCEPSQSGTPHLYSFNYLPPLIC